MSCSVRIPDEFRSVPLRIRQRLQRRLSEICSSLDKLERGPLMESLVQSTLAITIGIWRFRYEFIAGRNQIVVLDATRIG